jgi:hypothetical protein
VVIRRCCMGVSVTLGLARALCIAAAACAALFAGHFGTRSATAADFPCPNEAQRSGPSAQLPECRGYEMVSPAEKNGYDVFPQAVSSNRGPRLAFRSYGSFGQGASAGLHSTYLAERANGAWSTRPVSPALNPLSFIAQAPFLDWSPDLSKAIVQGPANPPLTAGATAGVPNLYLRDNRANLLSLVSPGLRPIPTVFEPKFEPAYGGASSDFSHVVFGIGIPLTPNTPDTSSSNLYEHAGGSLRLVSVLPGGAPDPLGGALGSGEFFGPTIRGSALHAVSEDGSTIFFTGLSSGGLFARVDGTTTVPISASQRTPLPNPNPPQPATYWTAATDGSLVFFTSKRALTNSSNTGPSNAGNDLYRFDLATGELVDLSVDPADPNGAEVIGVVGAGADGEHVYFVAKGRLDGSKGTPGAANLYVWHGGSVRYVATLSSRDDDLNWTLARQQLASQIPSRVSTDGKELLVTTKAPQPGFDNVDPVTGAAHSEVYRYDFDLGSAASPLAWTCVSCKPSGAAATGDAAIVPPHIPFAAPHDSYLSRAIGSNHRLVFFNSTDSLVPQDVNQTTDVYMWRDGEVRLVSTGTSSSPSYFADADESGENVYIATRQQLVQADRDDLVDVYDARVGGGTAPSPPAPAPCEGSACRSATPGPASDKPPLSSTFTEPGTPKRPVKKHHKRHRKRHHRKG